MSLRSGPRLLCTLAEKERKAKGSLWRQRYCCDSLIRVEGSAESPKPRSRRSPPVTEHSQTEGGDPRAEHRSFKDAFRELNPLLAPPKHFPHLCTTQPPCHIAKFKNALSYQAEQRIETTGSLGELSTRHMDMQVHLTAMTGKRHLELSILLFFLLYAFWVPFLCPCIIFSILSLFPPTQLLSCFLGLGVVSLPF